MKVPPSYRFSVLEEETFLEDMTAVAQQLDRCRQEGEFAGFDGKKLYYEYFQAQDSHGAVVIVHGLSEFTAKYHEFAWYLLNQGYDVFLYDQRCHGRSCRLTQKRDLIHVDHFSDYPKDLHRFICDVVRKVTDLPLYLYAHSMGGAVSLRYMAEHPQVFQKAVLSAPMIEPYTGISPFVARLGLSLCLLIQDGKSQFRHSNEFDPEHPFSRSQDQSPARFRRNMDLRIANLCYRTTPLSLRWVQQSLMQRTLLTGRRFLKKLQTPILMISGEHDTVVSNKAQAIFAKKCPVCRQAVLPNAYHSMLCGTRKTVTDHVQLTLDHFR